MTYNSPRDGSGKSLLAFIAGVSTALVVGGYFLFGPKGAEHRRGVDRWLKRARFEILQKMEDVENITEEQYRRIVDEVMNRYGYLKGVGQEKIDQASESFKRRWAEMREAARQARLEAEAEVAVEELRDELKPPRDVM